MANLVSGKLPPPAGMTYDQFGEYALYISFREFLRVKQGTGAVDKLDESYRSGSTINRDALLRHPMGRVIAALGKAIDEGASLPGWDNDTGQMHWDRYATFVRWFAGLNKSQQEIVIARIRAGSHTPWIAPKPTAGTTGASSNPTFAGGNAIGLSTETKREITPQARTALSKESDSGVGTGGWIAIIATVLGIGYLVYKYLWKPSSSGPKQEASASE